MDIRSQIEKAFELREEGYTLREIAAAVGVGKTTVERWLKSEWETRHGENENEIEDFRERHAEALSPNPNSTLSGEDSSEKEKIKLELRKIELQHERELEVLRQKDREISLKHALLRNQQKELELKENELLQKEKLSQENARLEKNKVIKEKVSIVLRFKKLFKELKGYTNGNSWKISEIKKFIEKLEDLKADFENLCKREGLYHESYKIWFFLELYITYLENQLEENEDSFWSSNSIAIDLDEEETLQLEKVIQTSYFEDTGDDDDPE